MFVIKFTKNDLIMKKIILLLLFTSGLAAQKAERIDSLMTQLFKEKKFNGNVLISENNKILYQKSFGLANEETKEALNSNSISELASVSKQFTAMGIAILKDQGKLKYDDKMSKYIPELSFYKDITIRNLLHHTSGLPDYMSLLDSLLMNETWRKNVKIATNKDIVDVFAKHNPKVLFPVNEKWEYSNTGYALLASIIEKVSGKSYSEFLKTNIFKPLKMNNTFSYTRRFAPQNIKNYAFGYVSDCLHEKILPDDVKQNGLDLYVLSLDGIVGDGTINSTTNDLLIWDKALYENKLLSEISMKEFFASGVLIDGKKTGYGFGWMINNDNIAGNTTSHSGSWPGYRTYIERQIDHKNTIIILMNNDNENSKNPSKAINKILFNIKDVKLTAQEINAIIGDYKTEKGTIKKIISENNKLYLPVNESVKLELEPITKTKFKLIGFSPDVFYEFIIKDGKVEKYIMNQPELNNTKTAIKQ